MAARWKNNARLCLMFNQFQSFNQKSIYIWQFLLQSIHLSFSSVSLEFPIDNTKFCQSMKSINSVLHICRNHQRRVRFELFQQFWLPSINFIHVIWLHEHGTVTGLTKQFGCYFAHISFLCLVSIGTASIQHHATDVPAVAFLFICMCGGTRQDVAWRSSKIIIFRYIV